MSHVKLDKKQMKIFFTVRNEQQYILNSLFADGILICNPFHLIRPVVYSSEHVLQQSGDVMYSSGDVFHPTRPVVHRSGEVGQRIV